MGTDLLGRIQVALVATMLTGVLGVCESTARAQDLTCPGNVNVHTYGPLPLYAPHSASESISYGPNYWHHPEGGGDTTIVTDGCVNTMSPGNGDNEYEYGMDGGFLPSSHHTPYVCVRDTVGSVTGQGVWFQVGSDGNGDGIIAPDGFTGYAYGVAFPGLQGDYLSRPIHAPACYGDVGWDCYWGPPVTPSNPYLGYDVGYGWIPPGYGPPADDGSGSVLYGWWVFVLQGTFRDYPGLSPSVSAPTTGEIYDNPLGSGNSGPGCGPSSNPSTGPVQVAAIVQAVAGGTPSAFAPSNGCTTIVSTDEATVTCTPLGADVCAAVVVSAEAMGGSVTGTSACDSLSASVTTTTAGQNSDAGLSNFPWTCTAIFDATTTGSVQCTGAGA